MDEILIEEKRYISSKRAAKITGYAKDYIGQLCREGRVPARLVGRSWYVLETAIQDHRFGGDQKNEEEMHKVESSSAPHASWEALRYESDPVDEFPIVNRPNTLHEQSSPVKIADKETIGKSITESVQEEVTEVAQHLQDSWRAWFDHVGVNTEQVTPAVSENTDAEREKNESYTEEEKGPVDIPVHIVYEPLPKELLPTTAAQDTTYKKQYSPETLIHTAKGKKNYLGMAITTLGILFAIILSTLAVISSGYFDSYIISVRQVDIISGITLHNK